MGFRHLAVVFSLCWKVASLVGLRLPSSTEILLSVSWRQMCQINMNQFKSMSRMSYLMLEGLLVHTDTNNRLYKKDGRQCLHFLSLCKTKLKYLGYGRCRLVPLSQFGVRVFAEATGPRYPIPAHRNSHTVRSRAQLLVLA